MHRFLFAFLIFPLLVSAEKPNVLLITIDTLRADHVGVYGNKEIHTPNLDALAKNSLFFQNAFCAAPLTLPSHTSLMTGRYPYHHGVRDNAGSVSPQELTLAEILKKNGYHTYAFVGGFPLDHRFGLNQGFDTYDDVFPREKNRPLDFRSERSADQVARAVLQKTITSPFFLWVHFYDAHAPYLHGGYNGEIEFVDQQIGLLLKKIQPLHPMIAVAGDHGESLGEHGEFTHRIFVYDSTMRVPFWITGPGVTAQNVEKQVRLIDFLPTMLRLLRIPVPQNLDGEALPDSAGHAALMESMFPFLELGWSPLVAIRSDQWKFIRAPKPELYDVIRDPGEKTNLYSSRPDIVKQLEKQIPQVAPERNKAEVSSETAEQLSALGYVSGGRNISGSNLDPKDQIGVWNEIEKAVDLEISKPSESISILEKAQKRDPENPMILGFLAQKYAEAGRIDGAKAILKKVLARDPKNALALYRMASVCLKNNQPSEARQWADTLRAQEPANADAWVLLGQANLDLGQLDGAAQNFETALKIDPADDDLRVDLGNVYLQKNETKLARTNFLRVLKRDSKNLQALNGIATTYFVTGDLVTAERYLNDAQRLDGSDAQTQMNLALLYSKQGKKAEAIALYQKLISSPETPSDWKQEAAQRLKELQ